MLNGWSLQVFREVQPVLTSIGGHFLKSQRTKWQKQKWQRPTKKHRQNVLLLSGHLGKQEKLNATKSRKNHVWIRTVMGRHIKWQSVQFFISPELPTNFQVLHIKGRKRMGGKPRARKPDIMLCALHEFPARKMVAVFPEVLPFIERHSWLQGLLKSREIPWCQVPSHDYHCYGIQSSNWGTVQNYHPGHLDGLPVTTWFAIYNKLILIYFDTQMIQYLHLVQVTRKKCDAAHPCWAGTWALPWRRDRGTSPDSNPRAAKPRREMPHQCDQRMTG